MKKHIITSAIALFCALAASHAASEKDWLHKYILKDGKPLPEWLDTNYVTTNGKVAVLCVPNITGSMITARIDRPDTYLDLKVPEDDGYVHYNYDVEAGAADIDLTSKLKTSIGIFARVDGLGFGISKALGKKMDLNLKFGLTRHNYKIDFAYKRTSKATGTMKFTNTENIKQALLEDDFFGNLDDAIKSISEVNSGDVKLRHLQISGAYAFNKKHFSFRAIESPTTVQKRSAGSFIVGGTFLHTWMELNDKGTGVIVDSKGLKTNQFAAGGGYVYNWVPAENWLIHLGAMPMVAVGYKTFGFAGIAKASVRYYISNKLELGLLSEASYFNAGVSKSTEARKAVFLNSDLRLYLGIRF